MRLSKYIILLSIIGIFASCIDLDIPPMNVVQDKDIFGSEAGVNSYLAEVYGLLPMEDFRYTPARGFFNFWIISSFSAITGEALCRDQGGAQSEDTKYWSDAWKEIREINYFLETLPNYEAKFPAEKINTWKGEMLFARAFTYFALVKRYGGVPILTEVLKYPEQSVEELKRPRSSEKATYEQIKKDLDEAYTLLPEKNQIGRASKYAAAGLKSRAMLFAGSIAKYNSISVFDNNKNRLCGIPAEDATGYFKEAYNAAKLLEGHFSLYKDGWKADDKSAQCQNFIDLFFKDNSSENILVRQYLYPNSVHGYDCYNIPRQFMVAGYSAETNPTLDYIELFEGFPKDANGKTITMENGSYVLYDNITDFFKNAEPRLKASVILPGEQFKGEAVEIWRGIYIGNETKNIPALIPEGSIERYEVIPSSKDLIVTSKDGSQTAYKLSNGTMMNPAGRSGCFYSDGTCAISGFSVRKWLNPAMEGSLVVENRSDQSWIEMRYAEILLNQAEAAFELSLAGESGSYIDDAYKCINMIRERAGATLLNNASELTLNTVRTERKKELGFENKLWWDLKRWRVLDKEQNNTIYRILMPFYADKAGKWFFDTRTDELNRRYTFDTRWYYVEIPSDAITNDGLVQNQGY